MLFSIRRTLVSVLTLVSITFAVSALTDARNTAGTRHYAAAFAYALEIQVYDAGNSGFVIGRPCHNIGFEVAGTPGDPQWFINSCG